MPRIGQKIKKPNPQLQFIGKHFDDFQKNGQGYVALCPVHDDTNPSLSINVGKDGRILLNCFAGCPTEAVLEIVGLRMSDLKPGAKPRGVIAAEFDYCDEHGKLLYQSLRYEYPDGRNKEFKCRRPDGSGGWIWKGVFDGVDRVPYRLQDLVSADPGETVFIVEGEKHADRLAEMGFVATCNFGGAGKWRPAYNDYFAGMDVVILPDNDDVGREHGDGVAWNLNGIAKSIEILDLPGLLEKGDIIDWIDAGGTKKKLLTLVKQSPINVIKIISSGVSDGKAINVIKIILPVLGDAAYHGYTGDILRAVDEYTEATPACVLAHLLPAVGTLIGPGPYIWAGNRQPARINVAVVGPTNSGRKGTGFGSVDELMKRVDDFFWQRQRVGGLSSGEGLITKVADNREKNEDGEWEITPVEKRLFVMEPEFSRILANINRESNILSQVIREAYDTAVVEKYARTGSAKLSV